MADLNQRGQRGSPQLKSYIKDKQWFILVKLSRNGLAFIKEAGVVCVKFCEELHSGLESGKTAERKGEREIAAGGPQHDWWVWNNRPPSCVFHQTHSSHLTLSLCPTRSLCGCKQRPLGMWFLCDGQKDLSHLWQEYPCICTTTGWISHHPIFSLKNISLVLTRLNMIWLCAIEYRSVFIWSNQDQGVNIENVIHVCNCPRYYINKVPVVNFSTDGTHAQPEKQALCVCVCAEARRPHRTLLKWAAAREFPIQQPAQRRSERGITSTRLWLGVLE